MNSTSNQAEKLTKLAEKYKKNGYEIYLHPDREETPDFLNNYRPDMIARKGNEGIIIAILPGQSFANFSANQYLQNLAKEVEQQSGWRLDLIVTASENVKQSESVEGSLQAEEITSRLSSVKQLREQDPELAIVLCWSLVEATIRLVAQAENININSWDSPHLLKSLAIEGIISRSDYRLLSNSFAFRNAIVHGFKTKEINPDLISNLIGIVKQLIDGLKISV